MKKSELRQVIREELKLLIERREQWTIYFSNENEYKQIERMLKKMIPKAKIYGKDDDYFHVYSKEDFSKFNDWLNSKNFGRMENNESLTELDWNVDYDAKPQKRGKTYVELKSLPKEWTFNRERVRFEGKLNGKWVEITVFQQKIWDKLYKKLSPADKRVVDNAFGGPGEKGS